MNHPKYIKPFKPGEDLYDNQKKNIPLLCSRRRCLLTDKTGSGKTLSVLYSYSYLKERDKVKNMVVLTPLNAFVKKVWDKDTKKFTYLKIISIEDLVKKVGGNINILKLLLNEYDIIYGKHTHVKIHQGILKAIISLPTTLLVVDEVHAFRNQKSSLTKSLKYTIANTRTFWGMTATPLSRNMQDAYNIIELIKPGFFGYFTDFRDKYCLTKEKVIGRSANGLRTAKEIVGILDEEALAEKLSHIVILGVSTVPVHFEFLDYIPSEESRRLYKQIAEGIGIAADLSNEEWIQAILTNKEKLDPSQIKEVDRHSSRFIYLQTAADGVLTSKGTQDNYDSVKINMLLDNLETMVSKGESGLVYFSFHASLNAVNHAIRQRGIKAKVLISSGKSVLKEGEVNEAKCKMIPHIILCTKSGTESESYYYMNNVFFFHIPTVPDTFTQMVGRITRKNSLFLGKLKVFIMRSKNIDLYKLYVVSAKSYQMELVSGEEPNIPSTYKTIVTKEDFVQKQKKVLLWQVA